MNSIDQSEIFRGIRGAADSAYAVLRASGRGFDPEFEPEIGELVYEAATTDEVSVYRLEDEDGDTWAVLVGTDADGEGRWAVRVGAAGVDLPFDR